MAGIISPFPILDEVKKNVILNNSITSENYHFSFSYEKKVQNLNLEPFNDDIYILTDPENIWHPDENDIQLSLDFALDNCQCLFGSQGIICENAQLGVALVWSSSSSKQRGVFEIGVVHNDRNQQFFHVAQKFDNAQLRGIFELKLILYVKQPGQIKNEEIHLANEQGCRLGELCCLTIMLDAKGSELPIYDINEPESSLLWSIKKYWDDPSEDMFLDAFSICFNKANNNFSQLKKTDESKINPLLVEVLSNIFSSLIIEVKNNPEWDMWMNADKEVEEGSLAQAILYFVETFNIDLSSSISISESIRKYLTER